MSESAKISPGESGQLFSAFDIKSRIVLPVIIMLLLLCSIAGAGFYYSEQTNLLAQLDLRGKMLSTSLSAYASVPMDNNNKDQLQSHVEAYIKDKSLLHHVSFYKDNTPFLVVNSESLRMKLRPETIRYFKQTIYAADSTDEIGHVRISLSTEEIEDYLAIRLFHIVAISLLVIIIVAVFLSILIEKNVVKPLGKLSNRVENLSFGHLNQQVAGDAEGEIGGLYKGVNTLRIRFKRMQKEIFSGLLSRAGRKKEIEDIVQSRILVVDDDPSIRMIADKLLQKYNMKAFFAKNGKEAIHILEQSDFDLMLLDLMMPENSGFDVLDALQKITEEQNGRHQSMPVIVVSSITDKKSIVRALHKGAIDYVIKPFNHQELIARVRGALKLSLRGRELEEMIRSRIDSLDEA